MFRPRILALLLVTLICASTAAGGSAQTPPASAIPPIDQFEGIQAAASRTFALDVEAMLAATPNLDVEAVYAGVASASVMVLEFDNAGHAATAYDVFSTGLAKDLPALAQGGTPEVTTGNVADIGSQASRSQLHTTGEGFESWLEFVTVQRDQYVFVVSSLSNSEEETGLATEIASWVATNGQPNGDEAIFVADGGSQGALWGFMPPVGDEVLQGLVPVLDEIVYPNPTQG